MSSLSIKHYDISKYLCTYLDSKYLHTKSTVSRKKKEMLVFTCKYKLFESNHNKLSNPLELRDNPDEFR